MSQPEIRSVSAVSVGDIWTAIITGVRHVHSLIIEAWGANGGITRILPQGRDEVRVELRFAAPGRTNLSLTLRDERLGASQAFETAVDVTPAGAPPAYAAERIWHGAMGMPLAAAPNAPPFQVAHDGGLHKPGAARAYGGILGPLVAKLGEVVNVAYRSPEDVVSVQFSTCSNAEAESSGPLPVHNQFSETKVRAITKGIATVYANAFNKIGENIGGAIHQFQIEDDKQERPRASFRYGGTSGPSEAVVGETVNVSFNVDPAAASVRFLAQNADVLFAGPTTVSGGTTQTSARVLTPGEAKIIAETYDMAGRLLEAKHHAVMVVMNNMRSKSPSGREGNVGFGNIIGPAIAALNERIFVQFALPERGLTVKFYASNAVVDFVGPMPVEEVSAETGVQMTQEGTATIWGEAFDKLGNLAARASHAVQVHAPKPNDAPVDRSLNDLAADMQRSLEASIRARLNRS